jgi:lipoyl(octanoyl) transferase
MEFRDDGAQMRLFESLELWLDGSRTGPENMAIDDALSRTCRKPVLRVYGWQGEWMSVGYFGKAEEVTPGRAFVRRPTGGGMVDHREDWTYSLIVPRGWDLAEMPATLSYQKIHECLQMFLQGRGVVCRLVECIEDHQGGWCFTNPVRYDLVDDEGRKIAGAGQRRNRNAMLHQGSVLGELAANESWAMALAENFPEDWQELHDTLYACDVWNRKR